MCKTKLHPIIYGVFTQRHTGVCGSLHPLGLSVSEMFNITASEFTSQSSTKKNINIVFNLASWQMSVFTSKYQCKQIYSIAMDS